MSKVDPIEELKARYTAAQLTALVRPGNVESNYHWSKFDLLMRQEWPALLERLEKAEAERDALLTSGQLAAEGLRADGDAMRHAIKQIESAQSRISELESLTRWIPVEERLPTEGEYRVYHPSWGQTDGRFDGTRWLPCFLDEMATPTYYRHLPIDPPALTEAHAFATAAIAADEKEK